MGVGGRGLDPTVTSIDFYFDPLCPFAWITSRFVEEVREPRELDVQWRFISLAILNAEKQRASDEAVAAGKEPTMPAYYRSVMTNSVGLLRVAAAVRDGLGNEGVARYYTAAGTLIHNEGRGKELREGADVQVLLKEVLERADLPAELAEAAVDYRWDAVVAEETSLALERTGKDVGTPIITFDMDRPGESSLFGPVINRIPRGDEALKLWDALATITSIPGMSELKRTLRGSLVFD